MNRDMSKWTDKTKPAPWFKEMTVEQRQQYGRKKFMETDSRKIARALNTLTNKTVA
jgi:hypothetical protein